MGTVIRSAVPGDIEQIFTIEKESFSLPWSRDDFESRLGEIIVAKKAPEPETGADVSQPEGAFDTSEEQKGEDASILGFCVFSSVLDEGEILDIAVRADMRGRGIGRMLMKAVDERAKELSVSKIFLEVRESNMPAQRLYGKSGFAKISVRKQYYFEPKEDAIIMYKVLY